MPSRPAKVYRAGQGPRQRNHAKAGLLFPLGGQFRMVSGVSEVSRQPNMPRSALDPAEGNRIQPKPNGAEIIIRADIVIG
jgi:hypothetical protein